MKMTSMFFSFCLFPIFRLITAAYRLFLISILSLIYLCFMPFLKVTAHFRNREYKTALIGLFIYPVSALSLSFLTVVVAFAHELASIIWSPVEGAFIGARDGLLGIFDEVNRLFVFDMSSNIDWAVSAEQTLVGDFTAVFRALCSHAKTKDCEWQIETITEHRMKYGMDKRPSANDPDVRSEDIKRWRQHRN